MLVKTVLVVFGTRPEAIKMAPVVQAIQTSQKLKAVTCATAQHRHLLDQVLGFFGIAPDFDLNLMQENQDLFDITFHCLRKLKEVLFHVRPDAVLVQGDTTTTFAAALASYYARVPIGHVEAGLRTLNKYAPFPEEMNRRMVGPMVDYHFAPTTDAVRNLLSENVPAEQVFHTGNTSIDALLWGSSQGLSFTHLSKLYAGKKLILLTAHRRENFGEPIRQIFSAIREFAQMRQNFHIIYPVHPNPNVRMPAQELLSGLGNVSLISPLSYSELIFLMRECEFILTDSGGIQEEAPTLGKPVLVLRETTERPEAVAAGCSQLVGHNKSLILKMLLTLSSEPSELYQSMSRSANPFGDGSAAKKIVSILEERL